MQTRDGDVALLAVNWGVCRGQLGVQAPVLVQEPPAQLRFSNSTGAQLSCAARGSPLPDVIWLHSDGSPVTAVHGLRQPLANGTLHFPPFRAEDYREEVHSTTYRCRASNLAGAVRSRDVALRAVVRQDYEVQVYRAHALLGNTAVLRCVIPPFVRDDVSVSSWFRDDTIILPGSHEAGGRFVVTSTGDLLVRRATAADASSRYSCLTLHALTGERRRSSPAQLLTVTEATGGMPPRLTQRSSTSLAVAEGRDVTLSCAAQANPAPTFTWWHESGTPVGSSGRVWASQEALHILGARPEDAGRWECRVNNAFGEQRVHAALQVTAPLQVHVTPHLLVVNSGEPATFNCSVSGSPVAGVEWLHNAEPLAAGRARLLSPLVLHVGAATRSHRGVYQCVARGDDDSAQASAELRLGDTVPELQWTFMEQALSPGPPVSLRCSAAGSPPPQFTWYLDGQSLTAAQVGHRYTIGQYVDQRGDVVSHVNISSVRVQDGGLYTCSATNSMGTVSHEARLNVYGPPYVRQLPQAVRAVAGGAALLRCPYAGYPVAEVSWERRGTPVSAGLRHELRDGGAALRILRVDPAADAGAYVCKVRGAAGKLVRGELLLAVTRPPVVAPFIFPTDLQEGARAQVSCAVSSGDLPIRFSWLKDNAPIPKSLQVIEKEGGDFFSLLVFNKVTSQHSGVYTCLASNTAATVNQSAHLQVNVAPQWLKEPQDTSTLEGNSLSVHCQAHGFPQPTISWFRGIGGKATDFQPLVHTPPHVKLWENGTLSIQAASSDDEGFYLCRADNGIGDGISKNVQVSINEPVSFDVVEKTATARRGDQVMLQCDVRGDHPIQVDWLFNGQRLHHSYRLSVSEIKTDRGISSKLIISKSNREDSGLYICQAGNVFGHSELLIHLAVQEPPDPPLDIEVTEINSRSAHLSWHKPFDGHSPLTGYLIQYKRGISLANDWQHADVVNISIPTGLGNLRTKNVDSKRMAVIRNLHPATTYQFRMLAMNAIESSAFTDPLTVKTQEEAPVGPPQDVHAEIIKSDELLITWKPPLRDTWNGDILGYIVHWGLHGTVNPESNNTDSRTVRGLTNTEILLKQLKKFTKYDIYVQAFNSIGPGPKSHPVTVTTQEGVPEAAPQEMACYPLSSQSMKISWSPPPAQQHGGIIRGYKLIYRPVISDSRPRTTGNEVKRTTGFETYLHGLQKFTNYSVRLLAYTNAGDGVLSSPIFCTTEQDVPGPPAAMKAFSLTSDSILVSWLPPENPNGIITQYTIYCNGKHHLSKPMKFQVGATTFVHEVRGLRELEQFEFWVTASTSVGEGESPKPVTQAPNSRAPARIASFSQVLYIPLKMNAVLHCIAVGNPTPSIRWLYKKKTMKSSPGFTILQDSLKIAKLEKRNDGNYSCVAKNLFGEDQIMYQIIVLLPPESPILEVVDSDHNSFEMKWMIPKDGGTTLQGYVLNYKHEHGSWEEVLLEAERTSHILKNLRCGGTYQAYITAHNNVGSSHPSPTVTVITKGTRPKIPNYKSMVTSNATSLSLHLQTWPDGGCPILYFVVEYRILKSNAKWILINNSAPSRNFLIRDLQPATWYELRITAHNSAGSTTAHFTSATTTVLGATVAPVSERQNLKNTLHFYEDVYLMVPIVCSSILMLSAGIFFYVAIHRKHCLQSAERKNSLGVPESLSISKEAAEMDNKKNFQQIYSSSPTKSDGHHKATEKSSEIYEMSPYATFAVSPDPPRLMSAPTLDYTLQFKTFGHSENYSGVQHECSHTVNKKHKCAPTHVDSERQSALHRHGSIKQQHTKGEIRQNSESDSSGSPSVVSSYRVPIKQPVGRSLEIYRVDSSTESNETSPHFQRRPMPHQFTAEHSDRQISSHSRCQRQENHDKSWYMIHV
ncbi:Down syndrome cell adhesion molecule-like protein Dscam2 [Schistocerca americana]|uniref:Down syndrome cell adhesion molecule-like protein Dscam2 n=1 Tax=Schistocerca americana TaxID=7009 RepID=UPI001F503D9E|nr:Down syndrome cell adhesion molecule-like protein Dscam2 [Schistocerca americana]